MVAKQTIGRGRRWLAAKTKKDSEKLRALMLCSACLSALCMVDLSVMNLPVWKELREVLSASIGLAGTVIGFSVAAVSVMLAMPNTAERQSFAGRKGFRMAAKPIQAATVFSSLWSLFGIVLLSLELPSRAVVVRLLLSVWFGLMILSVGAVARLVTLLFSMLEELNPDSVQNASAEPGVAVESVLENVVESSESEPSVQTSRAEGPVAGTLGRDDLL